MATVKQFELIRMERGSEAERYPIVGDEVFIGRSADASICVEGKTISRKHLRLWSDGASVSVEDLGSRNGFKINGVRVRSGTLRLGDKLEVGEFLFVLSDSDDGHKKAKPAAPSADTAGPARFAPVQFANDDARMKAALAIAGKLIPLIFAQDELLQSMGKAALSSVPGHRCFILAKPPSTGTLRVLATYSGKNPSNGPSLNQTAIEYVFRDGEAFIQGDVADTGDAFGRTGPAGILCAPLEGRNRRVGVLYVDSGFNPSRFTRANLEDLKALARALGLVLEASMTAVAIGDEARVAGQTEAAEGFSRFFEHLAEKPTSDASSRAAEHACRFARAASMKPALIDVTPPVRDIVAAFNTKGAKVTVDVPGRVLAAVDGWAFTALLELALEMTQSAPSHGETVTISLANEADTCIVDVLRPELTIPTERSVRFTADLARLDPDRGGGLEVAALYRLAEAQGGSVECTKGPDGQGTRIRIQLPTRAPKSV